MKAIIFILLIFSANVVFCESSPKNVMIFMAADNSLEDFSYRDLDEINNSLPLNSIDLNIEVHRKNESFELSYEISSSKKVPIKRHRDISKNLDEFIKRNLKKDAPNILILWGHGQGPKSEYSTREFGGIFTNSDNYSALSTQKLGEILRKFLISILIFDMCLMQNLKVITQLESGPEIIIGSAQIQNLIGLPYSDMMYLIDQEDDLRYLSSKIVDTAQNNMPNANFTFSAIYTQQSRYILDSLSSLNRDLKELLRTDPIKHFVYSTYFNDLPQFPGNYYDIGMYLGILKKIDLENEMFPPKIKNKISKVQDNINSSLINKTFGPHYIDGTAPYYVEFFQGLSLTKDQMALPKFD